MTLTDRAPSHRRTVLVAGVLTVVVGLLASPPAQAASAPPRAAAQSPSHSPSHHHRHAATRVIALPDGFRPEGVEAGPGGRLFAGSMTDGRIWVADARTGAGRVLLPGVEGRMLRGLRYDHRSGLLWAVGNDGTTGIVLAVDARSGRLVQRFVVPGAQFLNDLDVARDAVWVTDSAVDRLTRIPLGSNGRAVGGPAFLPIRGTWPTPQGNRANGLRVLDRHTVLVVNSAAAALFTIDTRTGVSTPVRVSGTTLTGGDGLVVSGRTLFVVRGTGQDEVTRLRLRGPDDGKGAWSARFVGTLTDPALDVPSTATLLGGRLWAVDARFGVADPTTASYQIVGIPLHR